MQPDDEICYCYHVSLRKLYHFARRERPRHPSRMSECLGAGTGCGWCIPLLCKIAENAPLDPTGEPSVSSAFNSADYAAARRQYLIEKKPRNSFDGTSGTQPPG